MIRLRHKLLLYLLRLFDPLVLSTVVAVIVTYRPDLQVTRGIPPTTVQPETFTASDLLAVILLIFGWIAIFNTMVRYRADRFINLGVQLRGVVKATTASAFWLFVIATLFSILSLSNLNILLFWACITVVTILVRLLVRVILMSARQSGYNYRHLLVVGTNERSQQLLKRIQDKPELGYKFTGFVSENEKSSQDWQADHTEELPVLGLVEDLPHILERERVDEIMVCLPLETAFPDISQVSRYARDLGIVLRIIPDERHAALIRRMQLEEFDGDSIITLFREKMLFQLLLKRLLDLSISAFALLILSPLMLLVALLIKLTSKGPILFVQNRVGMNKRTFPLYKFRSMVENAEDLKAGLMEHNEQDGCAFKMKNDPRITRIGAFIRKTSIDELPQLLNVLKGEMSLVGPRPPLPAEVEKYHWNFRRRLSVKPGITCFWQVSGRNNVSFDQWMQMDKDYIDNWSILLDLKILAQTIPAVLLQRGAS